MKRFVIILYLWLPSLCFSQANPYRTIPDIPYRQEGDAYAQERCRLDVYFPENSENLPVVVWFHGGGLVGGEKFIPDQLKEHGTVVVAINYRLLHRVTVRECIEDAAAAVAWVFREIENYGGNADRIFLSGHSAGGYLITLVGLDKRWLQIYGIDANRLAALIPFSGQAITHYEVRKTRGIPEYEPAVDEYAPIRYVRADAPPLVIVSGGRELELYGRYEENAYFWRLMKVAGHQECYLYELDGFSHGSMAAPAFHILKNHMKQILSGK
ncbi:MAG: alpha/beta hydrolase [Rikenellaceae bacterium]|nr:alpha/beta hydrolase [Rikenellaceae bacterium]